ncbi:MAG: protein kinase domain-containing protein [Steroidobacteraceae bacterium]
MTPDQWRRVKDVFSSAIVLPEGERQAFLDDACGGELALLAEVRSLLDAHAIEDAIVDRPAVALVAGDFAWGGKDPWIGRRIGPYEIASLIGHGGMGGVYRARRVDAEYEKEVAIKLVPGGFHASYVLQRLRAERQILANLEHPNIARLIDGGATEEGSPYLVMELVEGEPLDQFAAKRGLSVRERLQVFRDVCAAVSYAHQRLVVHRDLKPGNILVTADGTVKLLDFGIAKLLQPPSSDTAAPATVTVMQALTPGYSSPEQLLGKPITTASDIYSLAVVLYVLLTGRSPYRGALDTAEDAIHAVCETEPVRPSTAVREASPAGAKTIDRDLDAIILCALRKEPDRRYASAEKLSEDIRRHLEGLPVSARGDQLSYRAGKFLHRNKLRVIEVGLVAAALLALALFAPYLSQRSNERHVRATAEISSIAVLPLVNVDADPELEYLTDGLTENVINRLSGISRLKVIARDSVDRYRGKSIDPQQVGKELRVSAVLTGRITRSGDLLSISAELVDAQDQSLLWGERYEQPVSEIQSLQRELAQSIARGLRLRLAGDQRQALDEDNPDDPEAYELYLKGRYFWNKRTPGGLHRSINFFRRAVQKDPQFARAYAGLADSYGLLTEYQVLPAQETYPEAKAAALRAVELDPELAEARASLAYVKHFYEWDSKGAEAEFKRALEINPRYATAHQWYAEFLAAMGRHQEALAEIQRAREIDPLSLIVNSVEAHVLYMAGNYDRAIEASLRVIDLDPNFAEAYGYLGRAYEQAGAYRQAVAARQTRRRFLGLPADDTHALAAAASATNPGDYWRNRLEQQLEESRTEKLLPFEYAMLLAQTGDNSNAVKWLEKACNDHEFLMVYARVIPTLDPLRSDPRFQSILRRRCGING